MPTGQRATAIHALRADDLASIAGCVGIVSIVDSACASTEQKGQ